MKWHFIKGGFKKHNSASQKNKKYKCNFIFTTFSLLIMLKTCFSDEIISHLNSSVKLTTPEEIGTEHSSTLDLSKV